ncbi:unnamed protein product [Polarella glacialis]|uniref:Uncharacterized protein n=2 Tax=Polarella glacialis TaxID=89957 RepID=A0A813DEB7_POLGL|nr:unnamed protein product [Polarella glacialis]
MPHYEGLIPKTPANLALFVVYLSAVLYVLLRVVFFALRIAKGLFCFVCCCGFCRRKAAAAPTGKAGKAAEKGKAALASNKTAAPPAAAPKKKK